MVSKKTKRKPSGYWTLENCKSDAKKYRTRSGWHDHSGSAFSAAAKNGWLNVCCAHMEEVQKPRGYWTLENCKKDAAKYKSRSEWENRSGSAYNKARSMGWLDQCCDHMERLGNSHHRKLYAFEHPDKSVYVGLTYSYQERYKQHMNRNKILISKKKLGGQKFVTFDELYPNDIAAQKEAELIEDYRRRGWTILNQVKAGGLGGSTLKWDFKSCKADAKKYSSKNEWAEKSSGAWDAARSNGWIDICCSHMEVLKARNGTWTMEACKQDAERFKTRGEWKRKSASAYGIAWKNGWLSQCCEHMTQVRVAKNSRSIDDCRRDALKFKSRSEWQKESTAFYKVAVRNGWVDQCCAHMVASRNPSGYWDNKSRCLEEAEKYESISEWQRRSHSSYKSAVRNGWLDECRSCLKKKGLSDDD